MVATPPWLRFLLVVVSVAILFGLFTRESSDSDLWWHLRSGQYIVQTRSLPQPDPFAYTTALATNTYAGEDITRRFNLTHEWLAQVLAYLTYRFAGFGGIVLGRAGLLTAFCGLAGLIAYRRTRGFYRSLMAALAAAALASPFAVDRPYLLTFLFLAGAMATLEGRKPLLLWLLPMVMLIWANCHGGFVLGWVVLGAYSAEALFLRLRGRPEARDIQLWTVCAISALVAGLNPNGFRAVAVLLNYRQSYLTQNLLEWGPPSLWPPTAFSLLLACAAAVLLWARRKVRVVDWLLFLAFSAAALSAGRNTILIGLVAPVAIASYWPWRWTVHRYVEGGAAVLLLAGLGATVTSGQAFQLRAAEWAYPKGAADFILAHHIGQRMFNTYEYGGYLIWRLWPQERVFVDGRALSESVFADYRKILFTTGDPDGKDAMKLLDRYGVDLVVVNGFEYTSGLMYLIAPSLADPDNPGFSLVYADPQAMVFMRHPPEGMQILDPALVLPTMESACESHIQHQPELPGCARNLGQMLSRAGDYTGAQHWLGLYLQLAPTKDPEAVSELQKAVNMAQ